jgi:hypothetical protein
MRVERHDGPPDLQRSFTDFVLTALQGRSLDDDRDREAAQGKFPDFACFRGLLLIEMKHLESEQDTRINNVIDEKIDPEEKPLFFGKREGSLILEQVSNGEDISLAISNKLSRTIETHLSKANAQFSAYRRRTPRKNSITMCVVLNSQRQEFTPEFVLHAICRKAKKPDGTPRFPNIDAVLYISEKHFQLLPDGRIAFAVCTFSGADVVQSRWKDQFIDHVVAKWSDARTGSSVQGGRLQDFEVIDDIPQRMTRSDYWRLEYQRRPYMSGLTDDELRVAFNRCVAESAIWFVKGSWPVPPISERASNGRLMSHLIEETNRRGADLRTFSLKALSTEQRAAVFRDLPAELVALLS